MVIRDDSTNVSVDYSITTATLAGNYLSFSNIFSPKLVEGHFYDLTLFSDVGKPTQYIEIEYFAQIKI